MQLFGPIYLLRVIICYMIVAIDTGGTKTLIATFSNDGELLHKEQFATPKDSKEAYFEKITEAISRLTEGQTPAAVVAGLPGTVKNGVALGFTNLNWPSFNFFDELQQAFPDSQILVDNDATIGAVGAVHMLPEVPEKCLYITISTGVGAGFALKGDIEPNISSGEVGQIVLDYGGSLLRWEDLIAGPAIKRDFQVDLSDTISQDVATEIARRISRGLMALIPAYLPDVVVIGGGVGAYYHLFSELVDRELEALPQKAKYHPPIISATNPKEVVIHGCYHLAKNRFNL